ncbi:Gamma-tubulin complex component 4, partial [Tetrabaena socialis]
PRLETLVEGLRAHVARLLWRLLVGRAGLLPALGALKDYCLLARGDLWATFLEEARPLMAGAPRLQSVDADLAVPFGRAAAKSSAEGDPLLAAFSLRYLRGAEAEAAFQVGAAAKGSGGGHLVPPLDPRWDPLALAVRLDWPLGLLLGAEQLRRYNQLFALLLRLRRMQGALDDAWKDLRVWVRGRGERGLKRG